MSTAPRKLSKDAGRAELYAVSACQAKRCNRTAIRWVPTVKGPPIPLDHGRDPNGPIVLDKHPTREQWTARAFRPGVDDPNRPRYAVHWSTCHSPELYADVRTKADPAGELPPLGRRGAERIVPGAWCAACGKWPPGEHGRIPRADQALARLCLPCARKAVAAWSPYMRPTVASWPDEFRRLVVVDDFTDGA